jgi:hypothetical protein
MFYCGHHQGVIELVMFAGDFFAAVLANYCKNLILGNFSTKIITKSIFFLFKKNCRQNKVVAFL